MLRNDAVQKLRQLSLAQWLSGGRGRFLELRTEQKVVGRGEGSGRGEEGFSSPPPGERGIGEGRGVKADNVGHSAGSWGGGGAHITGKKGLTTLRCRARALGWNWVWIRPLGSPEFWSRIGRFCRILGPLFTRKKSRFRTKTFDFRTPKNLDPIFLLLQKSGLVRFSNPPKSIFPSKTSIFPVIFVFLN